MGLWRSFRASWRKSTNLNRVSRILGGSYPMDAESLFDSAKNAAEEELLDLIEADPALRAIMVRFGASRNNLQEAYQMLLKSGAGQWARGHWVAASALAFGPTLSYLLASTRNAQASGRDTWLPVAHRLVDYFERGKTEPIQAGDRSHHGS
jgi:hypothetical protein